MNDYFDDDENVKAMRATARTIGLTQLLIDIHRSDQYGVEEIQKFCRVLELLGVSVSDLEQERRNERRRWARGPAGEDWRGATFPGRGRG